MVDGMSYKQSRRIVISTSYLEIALDLPKCSNRFPQTSFRIAFAQQPKNKSRGETRG
jgi:hypothetical protein